jgi:uncharacterized membrane protein YdbT with pleckstrin-like domain
MRRPLKHRVIFRWLFVTLERPAAMDPTLSNHSETPHLPKPWTKRLVLLIGVSLGVVAGLLLTVVGCFLLGPWPFLALAVLIGTANWMADRSMPDEEKSLQSIFTL